MDLHNSSEVKACWNILLIMENHSLINNSVSQTTPYDYSFTLKKWPQHSYKFCLKVILLSVQSMHCCSFCCYYTLCIHLSAEV